MGGERLDGVHAVAAVGVAGSVVTFFARNHVLRVGGRLEEAQRAVDAEVQLVVVDALYPVGVERHNVDVFPRMVQLFPARRGVL